MAEVSVSSSGAAPVTATESATSPIARSASTAIVSLTRKLMCSRTSRFAELHRAHPHFRWVKLEEPMMSSKVVSIMEATDGRVGVLEGWGGMYILDLIPAGICGLMPGLAIADLLAIVFQLATKGDTVGAHEVFQGILPQIVFSLQNMELFHHAEKRLLEARGVLTGSVVRQITVGVDSHMENRISFLNEQILALLDRLKLPHNPLMAPAASGPR